MVISTGLKIHCKKKNERIEENYTIPTLELFFHHFFLRLSIIRFVIALFMTYVAGVWYYLSTHGGLCYRTLSTVSENTFPAFLQSLVHPLLLMLHLCT
jgi:hypothetical protein